MSSDDIAKRVEFLQCDLSDITIVKKVADKLYPKLDRLDMLIDNAGKRLKTPCFLTYSTLLTRKVSQPFLITRSHPRVSKRSGPQTLSVILLSPTSSFQSSKRPPRTTGRHASSSPLHPSTPDARSSN